SLGTVVKNAAFGGLISLLPGRDGLLHTSKVGDGTRVERVEDYLNVGDKVEVQIADIDSRGKIYLDKVGAEPPAGAADRPAGRDRGDRGERGDRGPRDRNDRERGERGPRRDGDESGSGGEGGRRRRRRRS